MMVKFLEIRGTQRLSVWVKICQNTKLHYAENKNFSTGSCARATQPSQLPAASVRRTLRNKITGRGRLQKGYVGSGCITMVTCRFPIGVTRGPRRDAEHRISAD